MMGRGGSSVCCCLIRPSVLLLVLLPVVLPALLRVEMSSAGDKTADNSILSDGSPTRDEEVKIKKEGNGKRVCSRDRKRGRRDVGQTVHPEDVEKDEASQRRSSGGTAEERWEDTRSSSQDRNAQRVDEGDTKDHVEVDTYDDERANLGRDLRRLLRHDRALLDLLINNTFNRSNISSADITSPHCGDGEFASILRSPIRLASTRLSGLKVYVNHYGEYRFYTCTICRVCPPDTHEILPCLKRRNAVCVGADTLVKCKDDGMVFYPDTGCVTTVKPSDSSKTTVSSGDTKDRVDEERRELDVVDAVNFEEEEEEEAPSSHSSLWGTRSTIITAGVVLLNILCLFIFITMRKSRGCFRMFQRENRKSEEDRNNASPTRPISMQLSRHHRRRKMPLPSISNQVDNRHTTRAIVNRPRAAEMGRSPPSCISSELQSEVSFVQTSRFKERNSNVFCEPSYERGAQAVSIPLREDLDSIRSIQVLRGKDPFWLVMMGRFGPEGGILCCEDSDFILEIPQGAIPRDCQDQLIIARISLCPDSMGPKLTDPDALWLGPLVELESPGLHRFDKNVNIRLPHRARLQPGWTFSVYYTNPTADTKFSCQTDTSPSTVGQDADAAASLLDEGKGIGPKWNCVEQMWRPGIKEANSSHDVTRVTFSVDEKYVNISSSHFSEYACSGCSKTHPLNLEAVVYWQHFQVEGREQMDLSVYIIDIIKDTRKASVENNERSSKRPGAQSGMSGYFPLSLQYTSSEVSFLSVFVDEGCMDDDWKWSLKTYNDLLPAERVISVESVIRGCCSSHLSAREMFSFNPKNLSEDEQLSFFQAMVCIKQPKIPEGKLTTPILVTVPLTKLSVKSEEDTHINDAQLYFVADRLPALKWRPLYRKLMGNGASNGIEHIQHRDPTNSEEQIISALFGWKRSKGRMATVEKLTKALEQVELQDLSEEFQLNCQDNAVQVDRALTSTV